MRQREMMLIALLAELEQLHRGGTRESPRRTEQLAFKPIGISHH